jgi:hypothetical protein
MVKNSQWLKFVSPFFNTQPNHRFMYFPFWWLWYCHVMLKIMLLLCGFQGYTFPLKSCIKTTWRVHRNLKQHSPVSTDKAANKLSGCSKQLWTHSRRGRAPNDAAAPVASDAKMQIQLLPQLTIFRARAAFDYSEKKSETSQYMRITVTADANQRAWPRKYSSLRLRSNKWHTQSKGQHGARQQLNDTYSQDRARNNTLVCNLCHSR